MSPPRVGQRVSAKDHDLQVCVVRILARLQESFVQGLKAVLEGLEQRKIALR